ncbi:hypothetical protein FOCC_FOCC017419 [Frankliniella occidentalis]|nr:hypothetical protein FOCC_FOCC017419 [Frankliniella occidentalis]
MFDKSKAEVLQCIPLSNNTVKRRVDNCAQDIEEQLLNKIKKSPLYALQLDESTDTEAKAQVMCLVRYCSVDDNGKKIIEEDFLFCLPIDGNANAASIFGLLDSYLSENKVMWSNCVGICTDGAPVMLGAKSGFKGLVLRVNGQIQFTHCMIHRESLAAGLDQESPFHEVLAAIVKMVNEIKAHPLQTRLFKILCEEVGAAYTSLLFYSKARWLSRGKVTRRLITLRSEVREFLYAKQSPLATYWDDPKFVQQVAYLADILEKLNELNVSMQGRNANVLTLSDKINGFQGKLNIWRRKALHDTFDMFPTLHGLLEEDDLLIKSQITEHLDGLSGKFEEWFGDLPGEELDWVRNPIRVEEWDMPLKHLEELSDLQADRSSATPIRRNILG